jgi:parallel beta-helix repeat protein
VTVDAGGDADYRSLDDAVEHAPEGSVIQVRRGRHDVRGQMDPADGVVIRGEGWGSHIRLLDGRNVSVFRITHDGVELENLRIDGNGARQRLASGNAVHFSGVRGGAVRRCFVEAAAGYNIVAFPGSSGLAIVGNRSERARQEGIELQGASRCVIEANQVRDCRINGILLWNSDGDCGFNTVRANVVVGSGAFGLLVQDGAHDNAIAGNVFRGSASHGVVIDSAATPDRPERDAPANILTGNLVSDSGGHGIFLNDVSSALLLGNIVRGSGESGIRAAANRLCSLVGNLVEGCGGPGLDLDGGGLACTGNVCRDSGRRESAPPRRAAASLSAATGANLSANVLVGADGAPALTLAGTDKPPPLIGPNVFAGGGVTGAGARVARGPVRRVAASVGEGETQVEHGLGYTPSTVATLPLGDADVWVAGRATARHLVLRASRPVDVEVIVG